MCTDSLHPWAVTNGSDEHNLQPSPWRFRFWKHKSHINVHSGLREQHVTHKARKQGQLFLALFCPFIFSNTDSDKERFILSTLNTSESLKPTHWEVSKVEGFSSLKHGTGGSAPRLDADRTWSLDNVERLPVPEIASPSQHCRYTHAVCPQSRRRTAAGPCCRRSCSCTSPRPLGVQGEPVSLCFELWNWQPVI